MFAPGSGERATPGPGLFNRASLPALSHGDDQVSQVPGEPPCLHAPLFDPGELFTPGLSCGVSIRPSVFLTTSALAGIISRGSITRPAHSLCTLRSADHSATTQHSVPAGGQPLPGGTGHPLGSTERFPRSRLHLLPLSQASPGALVPTKARSC